MGNVRISHNKESKVVTITLNKQPLNICDQYFYAEIKEAFEQVSAMREDIAVVLLHSGCKHFCAGGSLEEIQECSTQENVDRIAGAAAGCMSAIYGCRYPVIAAVHGKAIGAGAALAACCDVVIAADSATFSVPELMAGYIGASEFLQMIIPRRLARYYIFSGDTLTAKQMEHWGAVLEVVAAEELLEKAAAVAEKIASSVSPLALAYSKAAMNHNDNEQLSAKYFHEAEYTLQYNKSEDCKENYNAFKEKRKPVFRGK